MRKTIRIHGKQRTEIDLERLAHALLAAAREADKAAATKTPATKAKERDDD